jgi:hypothetical protein
MDMIAYRGDIGVVKFIFLKLIFLFKFASETAAYNSLQFIRIDIDVFAFDPKNNSFYKISFLKLKSPVNTGLEDKTLKNFSQSCGS